MYKKILVPIDGSEGSLLALDHSLKLAKNFEVEKVVIMHVASLPRPLQSYTGKLRSHYYTIKEKLEEYGEDILSEAAKKCKEMNIPAETKLVWGDPPGDIVEEIKKGKYDLVVMGSRGLSALERIWVGRVSNYVVNHANCPVLVVK